MNISRNRSLEQGEIERRLYPLYRLFRVGRNRSLEQGEIESSRQGGTVGFSGVAIALSNRGRLKVVMS